MILQTVPTLNDAITSLSKLSDDQLTQELGKALSLTVESITRAAACIAVMRQRGMDLSRVESSPLYKVLNRVAAGNLLPEVVTSYAGNEVLRRKISALPTDSQSELCEPDATVKVLTIDGKTRKVRPIDMTPSEIAQVFARDHIRNDAEQRGYIEDRKRAAIRKPQPNGDGIAVDTRKKKIVCPDGTELTLADLLKYAGMLSA